eukprot:8553835-Alexandrium_andersonii.AAC.1
MSVRACACLRVSAHARACPCVSMRVRACLYVSMRARAVLVRRAAVPVPCVQRCVGCARAALCEFARSP